MDTTRGDTQVAMPTPSVAAQRGFNVPVVDLIMFMHHAEVPEDKVQQYLATYISKIPKA